jgi:DnaJ family protein C protein 8
MATTATTDAKDEPVDTRDALEVLEAEAKEFEKDAEIDRILKAFRLDAYVFP